YQVDFLDWMKLGVPVAVVMLALCWWLLTRGVYRLQSSQQSEAVRQHIEAELTELGPMTVEERRVALVFVLVAVAWISKGVLKPEALAWVQDSAIAMLGAFCLFIIPAGKTNSGFLLDWSTAVTIPWDIILLMGGGFALASGFSDS